MEHEERYGFLAVKALGGASDGWDVEVVASDATLDREGEILDPAGWLIGAFLKNPVILAAHQHRLADGRSPVVGHAVSVGVEGGQLRMRIRFAAEPGADGTELGREYKALYAGHHMRAVSVGFMPIEGRWEERDAGGGKTARVYRHTRQELWEASCVAVPANPSALADMRAAAAAASGLDAKTLDDLADRVAAKMAARTPAVTPGAAEGEPPATAKDVADLKALIAEWREEMLTLVPDTVNPRDAGSGGPEPDDPDDRAARGDDGAEGTSAADRLLRALKNA